MGAFDKAIESFGENTAVSIETIQSIALKLSEIASPSDLQRALRVTWIDVTIIFPSTIASCERSFSALKRLHSFTRTSQKEERLSALALISIEKELIMKMREHSSFFDDVISEFVKKSRRLDFVYK